MHEYTLLTDGSVNTQSKVGYGAYLRISQDEYGLPIEQLRARVELREFTQTSSTKLELQTLLWALSELPESATTVTVYTDSQNIVSLSRRRAQFETNDYHSKKGLPLRNTELYQQYFRVTDRLNLKLLKVSGHMAADQKNQTDRLFALVDKASRKARRIKKKAAF
jgi:ribonuclease HI